MAGAKQANASSAGAKSGAAADAHCRVHIKIIAVRCGTGIWKAARQAHDPPTSRTCRWQWCRNRAIPCPCRPRQCTRGRLTISVERATSRSGLPVRCSRRPLPTHLELAHPAGTAAAFRNVLLACLMLVRYPQWLRLPSCISIIVPVRSYLPQPAHPFNTSDISRGHCLCSPQDLIRLVA